MASSLVKNRMPNDLDTLAFSDINNRRTLELARHLSRMSMSTDQEVFQICERSSSTLNNPVKFSSTNEPITGDNFFFNSEFSDATSLTPPSIMSTATASFPQDPLLDQSSTSTSSAAYLRSAIKPPSSLYTGSSHIYSGLSNDFMFGQRQQPSSSSSTSVLSQQQQQPQQHHQQQLTNMERFHYALSSTNSSSSQSPLMLEETKLRKSQNMTECVPVPSSEHVAEIVGRQGCKVKSLRTKTNTYIKTPVRGEEPVFVVTGRKEDVAKAKKEILSAAEHFSQIRASRKNLSGLGASELSGAMASLLGISGGANGSTTSGAATSGNVTVNVRVPYRVVGLVVGPKGATIKRIQQQSHTYIVTPSRDKEPIFEVTGLPENVESARKDIESHIAVRTNNGTVINPSDEKVAQSNAAVSNLTVPAPIAKPTSSTMMPNQMTQSLFNTSLAARKMFAAGVQTGTVAAVATAAKSQRNTTPPPPPPPPLTSMQESPYWSVWPTLETINKKSSSENLSSVSDHSTSGNFSSNSSTNGGHTTSSSGNSFNHSSKSVDLISFSDRCHDLSNIWSMPKPDTEPMGANVSLLQNLLSNVSAFGVDAETSFKSSSSTASSAQHYDNFPFRPVNFLSSPSSSSLSPTSFSRTPSPPPPPPPPSSLTLTLPSSSDTNAIATSGYALNMAAPDYSSFDNTVLPASKAITKTTDMVQSMRSHCSLNKCSICFESPVQAAFVPCGHNHFCYKCAVNVCTGPSPVCPCCQVTAKNVLRIYT